MRLINADELKERILIDSDLVEVDDGVMVPCIDFEYNIDNAPTVEAIPIEWLKKWAENGGNESVDDFTDVDAYCDGYQKNVIECLLRAWEKENE